MAMEYKTLINGKQLPLVGLGTYPLHGKQLRDSLRMAVDLGYTLFDTAHKYENEREIGDYLKDNTIRNIEITSKICGTQYLGRRRYLYLNKRSVKKSYAVSCRKLGVDRLGLYLLHSCSFNNYQDAYSELIDLYKSGKVDAIGVCNASIDNLLSIYEVCHEYPMVNQVEIYPFCSRSELTDFCKKNGIAVMAHSPFAHGDVMHEMLSNSILTELSKKYNKSVAQIILRWIVQQDMIVIPRSTNYDRLKENINIFDYSLSGEDMYRIDSLNRNESYGVRSSNNSKY